MEGLQEWMESQDTDPHITSFLVQGILSWTISPNRHDIPLFQYPAQHFASFSRQLTIGWFGTISGLLHPSILTLQTQYYKSLQSKRSGNTWGKKLILQLWDIIYNKWIQRNTKLHDHTIHSNHGSANLNFSIQVEHHLGALGLPPEYNGYFTISLPDLLNKNIEYKKKWFTTIRRAREIRNIAAPDAFSVNKILRRWVHLPRTPT